MPVELRDIAQALLQLLGKRQRGALATVVRSSGSTPQKPGSRLLLMPDGTMIGTVGGGAIEQAVVVALREALRTGQSQMLSHDLGYDLAMCCGGRMEVFVESVEPIPRLVVCGAGHVGKASAALARTVGFDVTVVDDRDELNTEERFPDCERVLAEPPEFLRGTTLGDSDWLLITTHDHALDEKTLEHSLAHTPRYVGLVGSERKVIRIVQRIVARRGPFAVDHLYAPVGVDLGAASPEEIAVSIIAELVALRHGRPAAHLRVADDARFAHALRIAREAAK